jgi:hypothetical protein
MIMVAVAAVIYGTHHAGLWFIVTSRIVSAVWAHLALRKSHASARIFTGALSLLHEAARLESVDMARAITVYQEIVTSFPGTRESKEAARALQSLASQPERAAESGASPNCGPAEPLSNSGASGGPPSAS